MSAQGMRETVLMTEIVELRATNKALREAMDEVPIGLKDIANYIRLLEINNREKSGNAEVVERIAARLEAALPSKPLPEGG